MGNFGSGNLPSMIERKFGDAKGAESVGFSRSDLEFMVEALNHEEGQYRSTWLADMTPDVEMPASPGGKS